MSNELPPELAGFAAMVDAQPLSVRQLFQYGLCLMMVEAGKMVRAHTVTADDAELTEFQSVTGETIVLPRPSLSPEEETTFITLLRQILEEEGPLNE